MDTYKGGRAYNTLLLCPQMKQWKRGLTDKTNQFQMIQCKIWVNGQRN
jgi:hypothetical protein